MATTTTNSVILTFGYSNTDFQRNYKFANVENAALSSVKSKIIAYNANIPAADKKIFIADDYDDMDEENIIGEFVGIVAAKVQTDVENDINLNV